MLASIEAYLKAHETLVSAGSDIASVVALILTAIALGFTGWQVHGNNRQVKARSIYDIQKDAREVASRFFQDPEIAKNLLSKEISTMDLLFAQVGQFFNFYAAVYQQKRLGVIDDRLWKPFATEIEFFLQLPKTQEFWNAKRESEEYDPAFVEIVNEILQRVGGTTTNS